MALRHSVWMPATSTPLMASLDILFLPLVEPIDDGL
jgi:hypothetical protein